MPEAFRQLLPVEVEFRPLASTISPFDFHIAWHRDNQSSVLRAFLETMRAHVRAELKPETNK
jgi:DNA-binding transcriptional LysR family regulator